MNNEELQKLVESISLEYFKIPFIHKATFNSRLRTTGGRYLLRSGNIEINKKYYDVYGEEELIGIIKHELCHYHLHQKGLGFQHKDKDFKQLSALVGAPRYCTTLPDHALSPTPVYKYRCKQCGFIYNRKRRVNTSKYVCGKCGGRLANVN